MGLPAVSFYLADARTLFKFTPQPTQPASILASLHLPISLLELSKVPQHTGGFLLAKKATTALSMGPRPANKPYPQLSEGLLFRVEYCPLLHAKSHIQEGI